MWRWAENVEELVRHREEEREVAAFNRFHRLRQGFTCWCKPAARLGKARLVRPLPRARLPKKQLTLSKPVEKGIEKARKLPLASKQREGKKPGLQVKRAARPDESVRSQGIPKQIPAPAARRATTSATTTVTTKTKRTAVTKVPVTKVPSAKRTTGMPAVLPRGVRAARRGTYASALAA